MNASISPQYSDKFSRGVIFLIIAQVLSMLIGVYSFTQLGVKLDAETLLASSPNILASVIGCLSPFVAILQIIGLVHLVQDSRRTNGLHRNLSLTAALLYPIAFLLSIGGTIASFLITTQGSMELYILVNWTSLLAVVLTTLALTMLLYAASPRAVQLLLMAGVALVVVGTFGTTVLTVQNLTFESYDMMGNTYFMPNMTLDRSQGIFPILTLASLLGNAAYLVAAAWLVSLAWKESSQYVPETVS